MIFMNIDTLQTAEKLTKVCDRYRDNMCIDVEHGRYTVDGCSVLGVFSLSGNIVKVVPNTDDPDILNAFVKEIKDIGGWTISKK